MGVSLSSEQGLLLEYFNKLSSDDQNSLLSFAAFLAEQNPVSDVSVKTCQIPELLPRPVDETVPKAIKRLSSSYPMLQDAELLHRCSTLMGEYILKGRAASNVIDELELLFRQSYEHFLSD